MYHISKPSKIKHKMSKWAQGIFRAVKLFWMTWWIYDVIHFVKIYRIVQHEEWNFGLQLIIMYLYWFINFNKCSGESQSHSRPWAAGLRDEERPQEMTELGSSSQSVVFQISVQEGIARSTNHIRCIGRGKRTGSRDETSFFFSFLPSMWGEWKPQRSAWVVRKTYGKKRKSWIKTISSGVDCHT